MKTGAESKTKLRIAIGLLAVAVLTMAWAFIPKGAPDESPAPVGTAIAVRGKAEAESLDPRLRLDLLANSEKIKYEGKGINIFTAEAEVVNIPQPTHNPLINPNPGPTVYTPPPPPPINLKYFGTSNSKGEKPKVFLSQGDDVWIAHEGDVVNRHYKVVRISPNAVEIEDLLNNNRQNIPLTQG